MYTQGKQLIDQFDLQEAEAKTKSLMDDEIRQKYGNHEQKHNLKTHTHIYI